MPKVSVIVPTYKRPELLRSAVMSVLNQTFQDLEIIVVDDASKDNTPDVINSFNDSRIKYIRHEVSKGGSAARNTGIEVSSGQYIAFLDDDDEWLPEKLWLQVNLLDNSPPKVGGIYTGAFRIIDKSNGKVAKQMVPTKRGYILNDMFIRNCIGGASKVLLRKECFKEVGLFDESLPSCQDWDMWIRISQGYDFDYIEAPLVRYHRHKKRISSNVEARIKGIEILLKKYSPFFALNKKGYSHCYLTLGMLYCYKKDVKKGRKLFLKAIRLYPLGIRYYFNLTLSILGVTNYKRLKEIKNRITAFLKYRISPSKRKIDSRAL